VDVVLGVLLGVVLTASALAGARLVLSPRRVLAPGVEATRAALDAATATLPHLRRGLRADTAGKSAGHLRALVRSSAVALCDRERVLAVDGAGGRQVRAGDPVAGLVAEGRDDRVHVEPALPGDGPLRSAVVAPLVVQDERVGSLVALYADGPGPRLEDARVVDRVGRLVSAQLELSAVAEQEERLARAELRALRAQISPHFVYNALAAVAGYIHSQPEEARELLTEFAEFTRYAFRGERPYVTLADELHYVEKYLRLEQARFGDRLGVRVEVAPEVLSAVVPVLSVQPLVENAVRHGVERAGAAQVTILGRDQGVDVELRVADDGPGFDPARVEDVLGGRAGGIGLSNVHARLRAAFGEPYGLEVVTGDGAGTTVVMTLPKFRAGVRAA
jgi:two-component system LytT family sensor kinase